MYLLRPVMATPPLCDIVDLRTRLTLDEVADLHELLDIKEALVIKQEERRERESKRAMG